MSRFLLVLLVGACSALPASAQSTRLQPAVVVQAATFPHYLTADDRYTRPVGAALAVRLLSPSRPIGLELALTHVPQARTDRSAAPRLTLARAGLVIGRPATATTRVRLRGVVGPTLLVVDAQTIDCGSFPLCSEWAAFDATSLGLTAGVGLSVFVAHRAALVVDGLGHVASTAWDPLGSRGLLEIAVGLEIRL